MKLKDKKLFLLDMDGTIYIDEMLFPGTLPMLKQIRANGADYMYLTNNSSRGKDAYVAKMERLGIPAREEDFLTSVDATIDYLKAHYPEDTVYYALGTKSFARQLSGAGLCVVTDLNRKSSRFNDPEYDNLPGVAVLSYDTEINYRKIEDFTLLLMKGNDYVATHPDMLCPTWYGDAVDKGCYIEMFKTATGRTPYIVGKPQPDMAMTAMKLRSCTPEETCFIGDRLNTDILCGLNAGIDTILVLSGDHNRSDIERLKINPTYVFKDISEVYNEIK